MDIHCPTRQKDQERARRAYIGRPTRFKDQAAEASLGSTATAKSGQLNLGPDRTQQPTSQDSEGFTTVSKKRKVRGRPPLVATADTSRIASMTTFLTIPSTQFLVEVPSTLMPTLTPEAITPSPSSSLGLGLSQPAAPSSTQDKLMTDLLDDE
jgi:hypothetical protein